MIDWFLPIHDNENDHVAGDSRINQALEALVTASTPQAIQDLLEEWREILFSDDTLITLCLTITQESIRGNAQISQDLHENLCLLEDARANGIRRACQRLTETSGTFEISPARIIELLSNAIAGIERTTHPYLWAELHCGRGDCYMIEASQQETRAESIEQAITDYNTALSVFTQEQFALQWAAIHKRRGSAYADRVYGRLEENLNHAIADHNAATTVFTLESEAYEYREIQLNLAQLYIKLRQREDAQKAFTEVRRATKLPAEQARAEEKENTTNFDYDNQESLDGDVVASAIEALLKTNNWAEMQKLLHQQQHILLTNQALNLLHKRIAEAEETSSDGQKVVEALEKAWYAHLAVHGEYRVDNPLRSRLVLAGTTAIPEEQRNIHRGEALDGIINLSGLRLLVLSACETALVDVQRIPDEMLGLAAGFLQAGVAGVIASLWAVDDHATYLLISRFAQLYLDPQQIWSPARALAEAQRWLREEATYRVLAEYDPSLPDKIKDVLNTENAKHEPTGTRSNLANGTIPSRRRSLRLMHKSAIREIHLNAALRALETPDELPYKDPEFWAAFIVTGC